MLHNVRSIRCDNKRDDDGDDQLGSPMIPVRCGAVFDGAQLSRTFTPRARARNLDRKNRKHFALYISLNGDDIYYTYSIYAVILYIYLLYICPFNKLRILRDKNTVIRICDCVSACARVCVISRVALHMFFKKKRVSDACGGVTYF